MLCCVVVLCYAVLYCVVLCVMLCCAVCCVECCVMLCCVVLCCVVCYVMLCCIVLCCVLCYAVLCCVLYAVWSLSCCKVVVQRHVGMLCHATRVGGDTPTPTHCTRNEAVLVLFVCTRIVWSLAGRGANRIDPGRCACVLGENVC